MLDLAASSGAEDHPRTRGEKQISLKSVVATSGSPPHARGKAQVVKRGDLPAGITPARAGKRLNGSLF